MALILTVLFKANSLAFAAPGFYQVQDMVLTEAQSQGLQAVYRIMIPSGPLIQFDMSRFKSPQDIDQFVDSLQRRQPVKIYTRALLRDCWFRQAQRSNCEIHAKAAYATAFFADQKGLLWTAAHSFQSQMINRADQQGVDLRQAVDKKTISYLRSTAWKFLLLNAQDQLIFDNLSGERARLLRADRQLPLALLEPDQYWEADVIALETTSSPPGTSLLTFASSQNSAPQLQVGFPKASKGRAEQGFADSNGEGMRLTIGQKLSDELVKHRLGSEARINSSLFYTDNDNIADMSGAPNLNEDGEVTGLVIRQWPRGENYHPDQMSYLIDASHLKSLRAP